MDIDVIQEKLEIETSVSLLLSEHSFMELTKTYQVLSRVFIFYMMNGIRIVMADDEECVYQNKSVMEKKYNMKFINLKGSRSFVLPIVRKKSKEQTLRPQQFLKSYNSMDIRSVVKRYVLDTHNHIKARVCLEDCIENNNRHNMYITCEIEFEKDENMMALEKDVFKKFIEIFYYNINRDRVLDVIDMSNVPFFPGKKFQNLRENITYVKEMVNKKLFKIKKKIDGYKARMFSNKNGVCYMYDDLFMCYKFTMSFMGEFANIVFQTENVYDRSDTNYIVIVDILGVICRKKMHTISKYEANLLMEYFDSKYSERNYVYMNDVKTYLLSQRMYKNIPEAMKDRKYLPVDGYLLVTSKYELKIKFPTLDVRIKFEDKKLELYLDDEHSSFMVWEEIDFVPISDSVYEVSLTEKRILRIRNDRDHTSSIDEKNKILEDLTVYEDICKQVYTTE